MRYLIILLFVIGACSSPTSVDYEIESTFLYYSNTVVGASKLAVFSFLLIISCNMNKSDSGLSCDNPV